jgi:hypothetical protein
MAVIAHSKPWLAPPERSDPVPEAATDLFSYLASLDVELRRDGDRLRFKAARGVMSDGLIRGLSRHKAEILALLDDDERERYEERAGIMEFDGDLCRDEAERRAFALVRVPRP